jgi:tetratricopeptide (TPR) repeat protein/predicted XRE-type DNA-binding protein
MPRNLRSFLVSILALWHDRSQKQIGAASGIPQKRVSQLLRGAEIEDEVLERLLAAVEARPAEVSIVTACLESLTFLEEDRELTAAERAEVELGVLELARVNRRALIEAVRRSRAGPALDRYPLPADREPARWHAGVLFGLLRGLPEDEQWALVRVAREYRSWALVERLCEESVVQASRDLGRAAFLARLARQAARRIPGPKGWIRRVRGFAAAHAANVLRVAGRLKAADALFQKAKRLWEAGSDPDGVLDPGRLLDLEASLRRAQRRFEEALALLEQARKVSRSPGRVLIKKGFTLEVMGEFERAIETLLEAEALPDIQDDPRLHNMLHCNLALNFSHAGRFAEAAGLAQQAREVAAEMGDAIVLLRMTWIGGHIAAGLGRTDEALSVLAQARREFAARNMGYDVALALLEEAALLLDEGRTAEVKVLTRRLPIIFAAEEVHREALAALRLFHEAAQREAATAELARSVLRYLFRARYHQGLPFER